MQKPFDFETHLTLEAAFQKWEPLFAETGVELGSAAGRLMSHFLKELKVWNRRVNLVSFHCDEELLLGHLLDSLAALQDPWLKNQPSLRFVDVGTGGGFPGLPLVLARPEWRGLLLESVRKKTAFLETLVERLPLPTVAVLAERAEDAGRREEHREEYDAAFCRAVGPFSTVLELTLPLVRVGGAALLHRGHEAPQETSAAGEALARLGGRLGGHTVYRLPHLTQPRYIVRIEKTSATPEEYPRRNGRPAKRPL
ncbi:MAG TPA: 16S rRNA (guanine(527)-N(7))-methyltransferase RsmG [Elusimicrobiota bacterium]|nr:16S rRNA (guanine(527)-N(7))-methyltransferase RsmG [Elusimicrobiota bacterium]